MKIVRLASILMTIILVSLALSSCGVFDAPASNEATFVGIMKTEVNDNGELIITYTNGVVTNVGKITNGFGTPGPQGEPGLPGKDGRGVANMEIIDGCLVVTYTDGEVVNIGKITDDGEDKGNDEQPESPDEFISISPSEYAPCASQIASAHETCKSRIDIREIIFFKEGKRCTRQQHLCQRFRGGELSRERDRDIKQR